MALWEFRLPTGVADEVVRVLVDARTEQNAARMLTQAVAYAARKQMKSVSRSDNTIQPDA